MKKNCILLVILLFFCELDVFAQQNQTAPWIAYPSANITEYGVYHFRKIFSIENPPDYLMVQVSADNRYNLFVNGKRICYGPAKGDLQTYKYDIIDIAPFLHSGENQLAALVYNAGKDKPMSLFSVQTAFFLKAVDSIFQEINTNESWKVYKNPAYLPISYYDMLFKNRWFYGYYACGPGDEIFAKDYPWGWELLDFDDSTWECAEPLHFESEPWNLVPRNIPFMDNHWEKSEKIRIAENAIIPKGFLQGQAIIKVSQNTKAKILIDHGYMTMGYPELIVNGGKNSRIQINYAEALYEKVNLKAHRDSVNNLTMYGVWDVFHPDGANNRTFRPLWKRSFRYVQLLVETGADSLEIVSFQTEYSGYPYPEMSTFVCENTRLNEIFEMGLRTLRLCSGETYYDTPYYEQLSYGGDNRLIAALSTYNSTDDRLLREVMRLYPQSENRETGLFKSAYPSRFDFDMGSWSCAWIQSLHDYYFMRGDSAYVSQFIKKIEGVLEFYHRHMDESKGLLGTVKNQNFMDWSITKGSIPRSDKNRQMTHSTLLTLYYVHTLDCAARLFRHLGLQEKAKIWQAEADQIKSSVYDLCWDHQKQLLTDYPDQAIFSQHTNILAILCDVIPKESQTALLERILHYECFTEYASSYFSFYLFKAMQKTGYEDRFLDHLDFWHQFINRGHTTTGETGFASHDRSDCHAWSAHPSYFLLSIVCGINPGDVGFQSVRISPHLGPLTDVEASVPHPKGRIKVKYQIKNGELFALITLPESIKGDFIYNAKTWQLTSGMNKLKIKPFI